MRTPVQQQQQSNDQRAISLRVMQSRRNLSGCASILIASCSSSGSSPRFPSTTSRVSRRYARLDHSHRALPSRLSLLTAGQDWNDGKAVCALVDAIAPGSCPDHKVRIHTPHNITAGAPIQLTSVARLTSISQALNPNKGTENAQRGIDLAQKVLSIPPILDAADMANPKVRSRSHLTFPAYPRLPPRWTRCP